MTRVLYMSDLHLEMERWRMNLPEWAAFMARHRAIKRHPARGPLLNHVGPVDLVVLAGDIHNGLRGVIYAEQLSRYLEAPVVMVAGNHEYYRHDTATLLPALRAATAKTAGRVQFLEDTAASFSFPDGRVNVLGCTLWTDYELNGNREAAMFAARLRMNDHHFIRANGAAFLPDDALFRHLQSRLWLHETLARLHGEDPAARTLIVTHHAPSGRFLGTRVGEIGPAYGSELLAEFAPWAPAAWIHGHTHYRHDTWQDGIRVVSAPRGYVTYDGASALRYLPGMIDI
jgi:predicted phosphodiesterase